MIDYLLTREQADSLFQKNAVFMMGHDVIFAYKIGELFCDDVCAWAESGICFDGFLAGDWNLWGGENNHYFYRSGFNKIVSHHNSLMAEREHKASEGGKVWDALWQSRTDCMRERDKEESRKRAERKAKREAAKRAKQTATGEEAAV